MKLFPAFVEIKVNIYSYSFEVRCPSSPSDTVKYSLTIRSSEMILAEKIVAVCNIKKPMYHEDMAELVRGKLPGDQTIVAVHGGVRIKTQR